MKYFALLLVCFCLNGLAVAQDFDSTVHQNLRRYALQLDAQNASVLSEVFSLHDSLPSKNKLLVARYDSLMHDSAFAASSSLGLAHVDAALCGMRRDGALKHYAELKNAYNGLNTDDFSEYNLELSSFLQALAVEANDYATAYTLQNLLMSAVSDQMREEHKLETDSLMGIQQQLTADQAQSKNEISKLVSDHSNLKLFGGIAMALLIVALVILIVLLNGSKKKLQRALQQAGDTSEKEELVMKLESARQELNALKVVARKQVEVVAEKAVPTQTVVASAGIDALQVKALNDEIQQGLAKIKSHCEAGKNSMSVPTYMAIINDTTRLSSHVLKRANDLANSNSSK